jgi:chromosome segregation ATPase
MSQISKLADPRATGSTEPRKDLFTALEQRVEALAERHREALSRVEDLRRQVSERDREIAELARRVALLQRLRDELAGRVEHMIERIDRMSTWSAQGSDEAEADGAEVPRA